ncbi:MAG: ribosomal RNA small subunit methyltransferase A [Oscillospiraceae bacterium]|nr:ribosomal RNA small subunit methyltransferase A [Oscillospiraceae bacterium]
MDLTRLDVILPLLERHGFRFSKSLGQNFLIRSWVPQRILSESGIDDSCGVLEIGPGIGVLSQELSGAAGKLVCVELDRSLLPVLEETLAGRDNVRVIQGDIMKLPLSGIAKELSGFRLMVCANLPYQITTPVLRKLLESRLFDRITVMIQKEVALRICAEPGTADYGAFSLFTGFYASPTIRFDVPPDCFHPRPKVTSSVITLDRKEPPAALKDQEMLFSITRAAFSQRRKTLANGLSALFAGRLTKQQIQDAITRCGFDERVRGETLKLEDYVALSNEFTEQLLIR